MARYRHETMDDSLDNSHWIIYIQHHNDGVFSQGSIMPKYGQAVGDEKPGWTMALGR